jgi:hypothetical protein
MAYLQKWQALQHSFAGNTAQLPKNAKPLANFNKKLNSFGSVFKALDAAIAKNNPKAFQKAELDFQKSELDLLKLAAETVKALAAIDKKNNTQIFGHIDVALKILTGQLHEMKAEIGETRHKMANPGTHTAGNIVPPALIGLMRDSDVGKSGSKAMDFVANKKFTMSVVDGTTVLQHATRAQQTFKTAWTTYSKLLLGLKDFNQRSGGIDQIMGDLRRAFDTLEDESDKMATATQDWDRAQTDAMKAAHLTSKPQNAAPIYADVQAASHLVANEKQKLIKLRDSLAKMYPSHFR